MFISEYSEIVTAVYGALFILYILSTVLLLLRTNISFEMLEMKLSNAGSTTAEEKALTVGSTAKPKFFNPPPLPLMAWLVFLYWAGKLWYCVVAVSPV